MEDNRVTVYQPAVEVPTTPGSRIAAEPATHPGLHIPPSQIVNLAAASASGVTKCACTHAMPATMDLPRQIRAKVFFVGKREAWRMTRTTSRRSRCFLTHRRIRKLTLLFSPPGARDSQAEQGRKVKQPICGSIGR